ncbi:hypothetical protein [Metabacillus arenae]|uniref:Uncharacterized protein n=1 Tax=Metabacillus arenae TaxID=2771434 RepID=A0A926NAD0_9BACI|nr:hypothetical protein [Metabacillus arenae]MBD1380527.1 hypothetical protein [Metabacillus arenae]
MGKENIEQYHDDSNLNSKRKANEEVLEISSTGYGLESVSKETVEEGQKLQDKREGNSSCGGL